MSQLFGTPNLVLSHSLAAAEHTSHDPDEERFACCLDDFPGDDREVVDFQDALDLGGQAAGQAEVPGGASLPFIWGGRRAGLVRRAPDKGIRSPPSPAIGTLPGPLAAASVVACLATVPGPGREGVSRCAYMPHASSVPSRRPGR